MVGVIELVGVIDGVGLLVGDGVEEIAERQIAAEKSRETTLSPELLQV